MSIVPKKPVRDFDSWRQAAREFLAEGIPPECITWTGDPEDTLDLGFAANAKPIHENQKRKQVPNDYLSRSRLVACHNNRDTWDLLYRILWRLTVVGEKNLLLRQSDPDISKFTLYEKAVRRERHKMTAFVRFRRVDLESSPLESYVAWYEPEHDVVRLASAYFRDRFATMNWSILTPRTCAHWNGNSLSFTNGVSQKEIPKSDELESYWKKYYASTFNPARLNMAMMEREMPRRYWKNLPEAELISELANGSYGRTNSMARPQTSSAVRSHKRPVGAPDGRELNTCRSPEEIRHLSQGKDLTGVSSLAATCQSCPLYQHSTQTVFGQGPSDARLMMVGEQPGDEEDLAGEPFVGPAGKTLHELSRKAGVDLERIYLTNAVKHFKWKSAKGRRLHQTPSAKESHACRPWLDLELKLVKPRVVLCLGATAARAVLGRSVSPTRERGLIDEVGRPYLVIISYHPAFLLRVDSKQRREELEQELMSDLKQANRLAHFKQSQLSS